MMQQQVCVCGSLFQRLLNSYQFFCFHSFNFLLLPNCCEAPLPATYLHWWQRIQQCLVAVMCANWWRLAKGPNDPDLLILTTYVRQYAVKLQVGF
jgi:hypothetical protein